ncbi:MAG: DUF721 domain-containing protein [Marinibacterium sp.]
MRKRRSTTKGFKQTAQILSPRIRKAGESRGFAVARVLTHWKEIVGDDLARITRPVEVGYGRKGFGATLTVLTTGAEAPMVEMQKESMRGRVNAAYGYNAISRIHITQTAPSGFAEARAAFAGATAPAPTSPDRRQSTAAAKAAQTVARDIADADLRSALEHLGQNILTTSKT